jgi:hypothetical protein
MTPLKWGEPNEQIPWIRPWLSLSARMFREHAMNW